jgi:putative restriction endonuclease
MIQRTPLIYLFGIVVGQYLPVYPVFIVEDHPEQLYFGVAVDERRAVPGAEDLSYPGRHDPEDVRRRYITVVTRARLHQAAFRERVLEAYRRICAICRLRHSELLEAAHILPDGHPQGLPIVPNGLALCSLHHAAFDAHILGVTPDHEVRVRTDVLEEADGPMLKHGLQGFEGTRLHLPRNSELRPNREFLAERYELFRRAG